jgi:2-isopropylmalate synthase
MSRLLARAPTSARTAAHLVEYGDPSAAGSRTYYAVFDAMQAVLEHRGIHTRAIKTHHGLILTFEQQVVKPGDLSRDVAAAIQKAAELRRISDYAPDREVSADDVRMTLEPVSVFIEARRRSDRGSRAPMTRERLTLYDTTLRDGAQTTGVDFSLEDKRAVAALLDGLGSTMSRAAIRARTRSTPRSSNRSDAARQVRGVRHDEARRALGLERPRGRRAARRAGRCDLLRCQRPGIFTSASRWRRRLRRISKALRESVAAALSRGREVIVGPRAFFRRFSRQPRLRHGLRQGRARGRGALGRVVRHQWRHAPPRGRAHRRRALQRGSRASLGIHAHDDCGCAVANSLAAVEAGARHIQGTLNGLGERCGNANLITLIGALALKDGYAERFETGVSEEALARLTQVSRALDEILNRQPQRHAPFVGASAFATKAGIHASAVLKDPRTYEHVEPQAVGNRRRVLVSDQAGRSNISAELERVGIPLEKDDPRVGRVLDEVKRREAEGYAFEGADASFFLLVKRVLGELPAFFEVERFKVNVERRHNAKGELTTVAEAIVKVRVGDEVLISAAEGNGPVNALDVALRKDLGKYRDIIADLFLVDYKVRIFQGGSDAVTRVLIESGDRSGERWFTVGVSSNIIDASFQALSDSMVYKLMRAGAKP